MKKLTILMFFIVLLVFSIGASAQNFSVRNMKFLGGINYNTYDGTITSGKYLKKIM